MRATTYAGHGLHWRHQSYESYCSKTIWPFSVRSQPTEENCRRVERRCRGHSRFSGVSACNQSFLNGLFQDIEAAGFKLAEITMVGMETAPVKSLVEAERTRFIQITTMPVGATP